MAEDYRRIIEDDRSLELFLKTLRGFNQAFADLMAGGDDFTLRLEVHGNASQLLHARFYQDVISRPAGVEKRVDQKTKNRT